MYLLKGELGVKYVAEKETYEEDEDVEDLVLGSTVREEVEMYVLEGIFGDGK